MKKLILLALCSTFLAFSAAHADDDVGFDSEGVMIYTGQTLATMKKALTQKNIEGKLVFQYGPKVLKNQRARAVQFQNELDTGIIECTIATHIYCASKNFILELQLGDVEVTESGEVLIVQANK